MIERTFENYFMRDVENPGKYKLIESVYPTPEANAQPILGSASFEAWEAENLADYFANVCPTAVDRVLHYYSEYPLDFAIFWDTFKEITADEPE